MVSVHSTTMSLHHTKDKTVEWLHFVGKAGRGEQQVNAEFGEVSFHAFLTVN
jgi:hypothetical protein